MGRYVTNGVTSRTQCDFRGGMIGQIIDRVDGGGVFIVFDTVVIVAVVVVVFADFGGGGGGSSFIE